MRRIIALFFFLAIIVSLPNIGSASITWNWSFDTEIGQFVTTGNLDGNLVDAGTYQLLDFTVLSTAAGGADYIGSISDGHWIEYEATTPYKLVWDGSAVSEWKNNGGTYSYWGFQNQMGAGIKRYYFGLELESYHSSLDPVWFAPQWASLTAAETYPPTPPGTYVASGTVSVEPAPVPLPSAIVLLSFALVGLAGWKLRFSVNRP